MNADRQIAYSMISKSWNRRLILESVDVTAAPGYFTVLCGENGSGKTTLLKILTGLIRPDRGTVVRYGRTVTWRQARNGLLRDTLYLHQTPYMFSGSVYRNLILSTPRKADSASHRKRVEEVLEWAQLAHYRNDPARTLSGGQQQRVALARASLNGSAFLFLDEPTANMDTRSVERTLGLLRELKDMGTAIMVCTHNPGIFENMSDRTLLLDRGRIHESPEAGEEVTA